MRRKVWAGPDQAAHTCRQGVRHPALVNHGSKPVTAHTNVLHCPMQDSLGVGEHLRLQAASGTCGRLLQLEVAHDRRRLGRDQVDRLRPQGDGATQHACQHKHGQAQAARDGRHGGDVDTAVTAAVCFWSSCV